VLVNNAAISRDRDHPPLAMPLPALRAVYEPKALFGVVAVTIAMLPLLRRSAAGSVANVSSGLGTVALLTDPRSPATRRRSRTAPPRRRSTRSR
jgi:short-subunit dehydrogenase involved in D-alanine esterification of teichoic acids